MLCANLLPSVLFNTSKCFHAEVKAIRSLGYCISFAFPSRTINYDIVMVSYEEKIWHMNGLFILIKNYVFNGTLHQTDV